VEDLTQQQQEHQELLEAQLKEALAAENFFETASGKLVTEILTKEITKQTRLILGDKFLKDHMGYIVAVSKLQANQNLLKRLQLAASPKRKELIKSHLSEE
jgi:hypothetical protein